MDDMTRRIAFEALITERHGMLAENEKRRRSGKPILYLQSSFDTLASQMRDLLSEPRGRVRIGADGLTDEERMIGEAS